MSLKNKKALNLPSDKNGVDQTHTIYHNHEKEFWIKLYEMFPDLMKYESKEYKRKYKLDKLFKDDYIKNNSAKESYNKDFIDILRNNNINDIIKTINYININYRDKSGNNYLKYINNIDVLKLLMENGIDIENRNKYGNTILFDYVPHKKNNLAFYLIDNGAEINVINNYGIALIDYVKYTGNDDLKKYFVRKGLLEEIEIKPVVSIINEKNKILISFIDEQYLYNNSIKSSIRNYLKREIDLNNAYNILLSKVKYYSEKYKLSFDSLKVKDTNIIVNTLYQTITLTKNIIYESEEYQEFYIIFGLIQTTYQYKVNTKEFWEKLIELIQDYLKEYLKKSYCRKYLNKFKICIDIF